ncbi:uncharacterized protein LOC135846247 [Planococcus citri]|uniref:uncharacterized protein LOC135846247 n=1 Tax=Planococcus citri TaxID=170843 RepID=UPI0031F739A5
MSKKPDADFVFNIHPVKQALTHSFLLRQYRHHVFAGLNTHTDASLVNDPDDASNFYQPPPVIIKKPIPCLSTTYVPDQEYPCNGDCVLKLVKEKLSWKRKDKLWKNLARKSLRSYDIMDKIRTELKRDDCINSLPYVITRLVNHASHNPDEHFEGVYNWYYGNSIATADFGGQTCLLFAGGKQRHEFYFSFYDRSSASVAVPEVSPKMKIPLAEDTPIYDIIPGKDYNSVGVRQRNYCYFFVYDDNNEDIVLNKCLKVKKNEHPFVGMDSFEREFCTIDSGRYVNLWSPHVRKDPICSFTLPPSDTSLPDKFARIRYSATAKSQALTIIDRKQLYFYDDRINFEKPVSVFDPSKMVELCEDLCLLVPSLVDNYWYLGSTHSCLMFDARAGFVQKWTHMLSQSPSVGSTIRINKEKASLKECFLLGTQSTGEIVAIYNKWTANGPKSDVLPVEVPNRIDTLHEARCNSLLTDPSLTKKFSHSLIGIAPYKKKKRIGLFSLSSTGDVYHQCIQKRSSSSPWRPEEQTKLQEVELNHLKDWQTGYLRDEKKQKSTITVTRVVNMRPFSENIPFHNPEIPTYNRPDLSGRAIWKKSKKTLESFRDFLTPTLLHDFGIDEQSEWGSEDEEQFETVPNVTTSSYGKVSVWLSSVKTEEMDNFVDVDELFVKTEEPKEEDIEQEIEDLEVSVSSDESVGHSSRMSYGFA